MDPTFAKDEKSNTENVQPIHDPDFEVSVEGFVEVDPCVYTG